MASQPRYGCLKQGMSVHCELCTLKYHINYCPGVLMSHNTMQVQALQFEWAWQHPEKSKAVRDLVAQLKGTRKSAASITGAKGKVICMSNMPMAFHRAAK